MHYKDGICHPTVTETEIRGFFGDYRFLSNFYRIDQLIEVDGIAYSSSENAYMAQKTTDNKVRKIFSHLSQSEAKVLGRNIVVREDWTKEFRIEAMLKVLRVKFSINDLAVKLLDTDEKVLIEENDWNDTFWGVCDGVGENNLGRLLMQVRKEIRA